MAVYICFVRTEAIVVFFLRQERFVMEFPAVRWRLPAAGAVKVNVSGFFSDQPLRNGNRSGIGVVIRDQRGKIIRLFAGSLGIEDKRVNEFYAMFQGLVRAYVDDQDVIELETDNLAAHWEWINSMNNGVPHEHLYIVQQLNQRKADENLSLVTRGIDTDSNEMAMYLARHGAENYKKMVIISQPFGRIHEIWSHDMGLGPVGEQFVAMFDEDLAGEVVNGEIEEAGGGLVNEEEVV